MSTTTVEHVLGDRVSVVAGGVELARYVYSTEDPQGEAPRPFFHPLRSRAGDVVSVYRPWDHLWHKGLALSLPHLGTENFWGGPTYVHPDGYTALPNDGAMRVSGPVEVSHSGSDGAVRIAHDAVWTTQGGADVVHERRTITVGLFGDDAWGLRVSSDLANVSGATIPIGSPTTAGRPNAGYGGWFWRGPRSFQGGAILLPSGESGDEAMGTPGEWAGFVGHHDESDRFSTVVMVDGEDSVRHPPKWFARSTPFACLCPAPFFDEEFAFEPDAVVRLSAALLVADGRLDVDAAGRLAADGARMPV